MQSPLSPKDFLPYEEREPPLHRAARTGDLAAIRRLVAAGEQINAIANTTRRDPDIYELDATPLMVAAGSGDGADVETLRLLLELGADPKVETYGRTAATFACLGAELGDRPGGDAARLRFLLHTGCPLPADPDYANDLLCNTAATGDPQRLRVLLEHGLSARGHWDPVKAWTSDLDALRHALERMQRTPGVAPDVVAFCSARIDECTLDRFSTPPAAKIPLFRAAGSGSEECVGLLLAAGADPHSRDDEKRTAMYCASSTPVVRALTRAGLLLEDTDTHGMSPLEHAVDDGKSGLARVRALIEAGADANSWVARGIPMFLLGVLSWSRSRESLRQLVALGADPHAIDSHGSNAFHWALNEMEWVPETVVRETLGYLKELGVDIERRNNDDRTPLAKALRFGSAIEVCVLCELGADPNAVCTRVECFGDTCNRTVLPLLFHAAARGGPDKNVVVRALLSAGADPLAKDGDGLTPLTYAVDVLCARTLDEPQKRRDFYAGLTSLDQDLAATSNSRDEYIARITPPLRAYLDRFAADIPFVSECDFAQKWRDEELDAIVTLCAHEYWARHSTK